MREQTIRKYKMKNKKSILDSIDIDSVKIEDMDIKGLYKLADRAERIVRRGKKKGIENDTEQR